MVNHVEMTEALDAVPGSVRELAAEANVSDSLLRHVRDGRRRLTAETRRSVVAALRRWSERCAVEADRLASVDLTEPGGGEG